jgi:hypothetical protein
LLARAGCGVWWASMTTTYWDLGAAKKRGGVRDEHADRRIDGAWGPGQCREEKSLPSKFHVAHRDSSL